MWPFSKFLNNKKAKDNTDNAVDNKTKIIRTAFVLEGELFKPSAYVSIDAQDNLMKNKERLSQIRQEIKECMIPEFDNNSTGYVISEFGVNLPSELMELEYRFEFLNPNIEGISLEEITYFRPEKILPPEKITPLLKAHAVIINYSFKVFRGIDFKISETLDYKVTSNDLVITPKGSVEKYEIKLFEKYNLTYYIINEEEL